MTRFPFLFRALTSCGVLLIATAVEAQYRSKPSAAKKPPAGAPAQENADPAGHVPCHERGG
jgi:hypothetical protein